MNSWDVANVRQLLSAHWLHTLALVLLLVWFTHVLAKTLWLVIAGPQEIVPASHELAVIGTGSTTQQVLFSKRQVEDWQLFGTPNEAIKAVAPSDDEKNAPATTLKLTLVGVFANTNQDISGAIIKSGSNAELYRVGDELPGRAELYKVFPDRVLLKRMGKTETLRLEVERQPGKIEAAETTPTLPDLNAAASQGLDTQRGMLISQLALTPVRDGSNEGYRVSAKISRDVRRAVGLRPGDVILSVNGMPLGTDEADQAAISSFYESGKAEVEIQRGGSQITLTYPP